MASSGDFEVMSPSQILYFNYSMSYYFDCKACKSQWDSNQLKDIQEEVQKEIQTEKVPITANGPVYTDDSGWDSDDEEYEHNHDDIDVALVPSRDSLEEEANHPKLFSKGSDLSEQQQLKLCNLMTNGDIFDVSLDSSPVWLLDGKIWDLMINIRHLSLDGCRFQEVPSAVRRLVQLKSLSLESNGLSEIPKWIGELSQLRELKLEGNRLTKVPDSICNLVHLEHLSIGSNLLESFPEKIGHLKKLRVLVLSYNRIEKIPESLGSLTSLVHLEIAKNRLTHLCESFGKLPNIEYLDLSENGITELPIEFASAHKLKQIDLDSNDVYAFPDWFTDVPHLVTISARTNKLRGNPFPKGFCQNSKNLTNLYFAGNYIETLPESIAQITTLAHCDLGSPFLEPERNKSMKNGNSIRYLPSLFGALGINLIELRLDENEVEALPENFGQGLVNLERLNLYSNNLTELPKTFCLMKKLRVLILSMNRLKQLDESFGELDNLVELRLDQNELSYLPHSFKNFTELTELDLYDNKFDCFPSVLRYLPKLNCLGTGIHIADMCINLKFATTIECVKRLHEAMKKGLNKWGREESCVKKNKKSINHEYFESLKLDTYFVKPNLPKEKPRNIFDHSSGIVFPEDEWDDNYKIDHEWDPIKYGESIPKKPLLKYKLPPPPAFHHIPRLPKGLTPRK